MLEIYTKHKCKNCEKIKSLLDSLNTQYIEINIDDKKKAYEYWKSLEVNKVPILIFKKNSQNVILVNCTEKNVKIFLKTYGLIQEK